MGAGQRDTGLMSYALMTYALMTCALLSSVGVRDGQAHEEELMFRFQAGDKYFLASVAEQIITRIADGNEQAVEQTIRLGCDLDVEEVEEDGCAWAKYTYRQASMKIKGPGVDATYDSHAKNQSKMPAEALPLALVLGESFYVKITPQGHIDKINGLQAMVISTKNKITQAKDRERFGGAIENQFAESAIRRMLENQLAVFPSPILDYVHSSNSSPSESQNRAGRAWSRTEQINEEATSALGWLTPGVPVVVEQTWRLRETSGPVVVVDVNLVVRAGTGAEETTIDDAKARREVRGQGAGRVEIEKPTGRIIINTVTTELVEKIEVLAKGVMLRPGPSPEPIRTHATTTFQMFKRETPSDASQTNPPSPAKSEANQPAD